MRNLVPALAVVAVCAGLHVHVAGAVIDFNSYGEGDTRYGAFIDVATGVTFSNPRDGTPGTFTFDYVGTAYSQIPRSAAGVVLSSGGYAPGNAVALGYPFGFTATLPTPATSVAFDVLSDSNPQQPAVADLFLLDAAGQSIESRRFTLNGGLLTSTTLSLSRPTADIYGFRFFLIDAAGAADNIVISVPEPAIAGGMIAMLAAAVRRGDRRKR